jgi:hypothetical protein
MKELTRGALEDRSSDQTEMSRGKGTIETGAQRVKQWEEAMRDKVT